MPACGLAQARGRVWLQSRPIRKLIRALAPAGGNARKESGEVLSSLFNGVLDQWRHWLIGPRKKTLRPARVPYWSQ